MSFAQRAISTVPVTTKEIATFELITPEMAADLLSRNHKNRKMSTAAIRRYKNAMINGKWQSNGSTIVVARDGSLLDGQQRLTASVQANIPFKTIVVRECDPSVFESIDSGKKRTASDALSIKGYVNTRTLAAAVRWIYAFKHGNPVNGPAALSNNEVCEWVNENPDVASINTKSRHLDSILIGSLSVALKFLFNERSESACDRFFADLLNPAGLSGDDAVWLLERRLSRNVIRKEKLPSEEVAALVIRAWNHRRTGETKTLQLKGLIRREDGSASMPEIL